MSPLFFNFVPNQWLHRNEHFQKDNVLWQAVFEVLAAVSVPVGHVNGIWHNQLCPSRTVADGSVREWGHRDRAGSS